MATHIHWRFWERERGDCSAIEPLLSLYADDMASASEIRRVEAHLHTCEDCRQALEWMRTTRQVIVSRPAVAPPPELRARIARAIAELEAAKAPVRPVRRPLPLRPAFGYGFGVALFAALGWGLWSADNLSLSPVRPMPHPPHIASSRPPTVPVVPITSPNIPVKRHHILSTASPVIADRDTQKPTRQIVRRRPSTSVVSPALLTASVDTGHDLLPTRISPLRPVTRVTPAHHIITSPSGPRMANRLPPVTRHQPSVKPVHPDSSPLVASLPSPPVLPNVSTPTVRVLSPTVTPDQVHTASLTPSQSVNDTLRGIASYVQHKATLTSRTFTANSRTVAATVALASADSSGTANITEGPVR